MKNFVQKKYQNETDLCTNCWNQKAVLTNVSYEYFDGTLKFGPMCKDCFNSYSLEQSTVSFNV
jgi:hypothetical protein